MSLSINTSHSTAFGGKMLSARDQSRVNGSCIHLKIEFLTFYVRLPWWFSGKRICLQRRRLRRLEFNPWVGNDPLEKEMATHSSSFAWETPWTEEPGKLQLMGSQRVGHNN